MTGNEVADLLRLVANERLREEVEYALGLHDDHLAAYMTERRTVPLADLGPHQDAGARFVGRSGDGGYILDFDVPEEQASAALEADLASHATQSKTVTALADRLSATYGDKEIPWFSA